MRNLVFVVGVAAAVLAGCKQEGPACQPKTCAGLGATCGTVDDGCGTALTCGDCTDPETCGGGGTANRCGCTPFNSCAAHGHQCGSVPDGCGGEFTCGQCTGTQTCGGGGVPFQCGCTAKTRCAEAGAFCGIAPDGCGGTLTCAGSCSLPQTCSGGGTPNQCGCTPITCDSIGADCGTLDDGCGTTLTCGTGSCSFPATCGGGGTPLVCGCTPTTCTDTSLCGSVPDGCGGLAACAPCGGTDVCGGDGHANQCAPLVPFLAALQPTLIRPGQTLNLEGNFRAGATLTFTGNTSATLTLLGNSRATVVVPAAARTGPVTLTVGTVSAPPVPLTVTAQPLGLRSFDVVPAQTDAARATPTLLTAREHHAVAVIEPYVYVVGGKGTAPLQSVERARINADGSVGAFEDAGVQLTAPRERHSVAVTGGRLYVVGGVGSGDLRSVEAAVINADGTLQPFAVVPATLQAARRDHCMEVIGNRLYVFGGRNDNGHFNTFERASIRSDGTLGAFATVPGVRMASVRFTHESAVIGSRVWLLGGIDETGTTQQSVESAPIDGDGNVGAFSISPGTMATPRFDHATFQLGDGVYVVGGRGPAGAQPTVERAPIAADGMVGAFATVGSLTLSKAREAPALATAGHRLLVLGGRDAGGPLASVESATLHGDTDTGAFATVTGVNLLTARTGHAQVALGKRLYVVGGYNAANHELASVEHSDVTAEGVPGPFSADTVTLQNARQGHALLVVQDKLYAVGGWAGTAPLASVEVATITADGTPGPFTTSTVTLATARRDFTLVATSARVFALGGVGAAGPLDSMESAVINADGTLGAFSVENTVMPAPRGRQATMVARPYVYLLGGETTGGAELATVIRAPINLNGTLGGWEAGGTLTAGRHSGVVVRAGRYVYVAGGVSGGAVVGTTERAELLDDGGLGAFAAVPVATMTVKRQGHRGAVLGDGLLVYGGVGTGAELDSAVRAPLR